MVATPNLFQTRFLFSVRRPVAIPVATDGDSTGEVRESSHLIKYANLIWFSLMFSFPIIFVCIFLSLSAFVYVYLLEYFGVNCFPYFVIYLPGKFSDCFAGRFGHAFSPFTHTHCAYHEWGPIPGSVYLRIRGDCVAVPQWMNFPSGHCENPS